MNISDDHHCLRIAVLNFTKDWLIPVFGTALAILGIVLTFQANANMDRADALQKMSEKSSLQASMKKLMFNLPVGGKEQFSSGDRIKEILNVSFGETSSQLGNEYLISNATCYVSWKSFDEFLMLATWSPDVFDLMGSGHSIADSYYEKFSALMNNCWNM